MSISKKRKKNKNSSKYPQDDPDDHLTQSTVYSIVTSWDTIWPGGVITQEEEGGLHQSLRKRM